MSTLEIIKNKNRQDEGLTFTCHPDQFENILTLLIARDRAVELAELSVFETEYWEELIKRIK